MKQEWQQAVWTGRDGNSPRPLSFEAAGAVAYKKGANMSLYENINKRKKAGTSRSKKKSTVSAKSYKNMKAGFPNSKKNKAKKS